MLFAKFVEILTALLCIILVINRYRGRLTRIVPGDIILWTLSIFYILPLFLSAFGFVDAYRLYPALGTAARSVQVTIIAAFVVAVAIFMVARGVRASALTAPTDHGAFEISRSFWLLLTICPLAVVAVAPDPGVYTHFAAAFTERGVGEPFFAPAGTTNPLQSFQIYVTASTYVSALALALWLYSRKTRRAFLLVPPVLLLDFWLEGKRNIVAVIAILVLFAFLVARDGLSRRSFRRAAVIGGIVLAGVITVSQVFQTHFRPTVLAADGSHEVFQIDFGRLDVLRLAIADQFTSSVPEPLSYPGESLFLYADQLADRLTNIKPISYESRVTSIAQEVPIQTTHGSITTSIISESIDNFNVFGILVGPGILLLLIRWSGRTPDPLLRILIPIFGALLIATNVVATAPLILLIILRVFWNRFRPSTMVGEPALSARRQIKKLEFGEIFSNNVARRSEGLS